MSSTSPEASSTSAGRPSSSTSRDPAGSNQTLGSNSQTSDAWLEEKRNNLVARLHALAKHDPRFADWADRLASVPLQLAIEAARRENPDVVRYAAQGKMRERDEAALRGVERAALEMGIDLDDELRAEAKVLARYTSLFCSV